MFTRIATHIIQNMVSMSVNISFLFGVVGVVSGIWNLISPVPDHCLSFHLAMLSYGFGAK